MFRQIPGDSEMLLEKECKSQCISFNTRSELSSAGRNNDYSIPGDLS